MRGRTDEGAWQDSLSRAPGLVKLASFLRGRGAELLADFERGVHDHGLLEGTGATRPYLVEDVPRILERAAAIADALAAGKPLPGPGRELDLGAPPRGYDLAEVALEYTVLRRCVVRRSLNEAPELGVAELNIVHEAIEEARTRVAARFSRLQFEAQERVRQVEVRNAALLEEFRTLANSIPQLAWMADGAGFIFWYNQRWYDYTGTTLDEMRGWGWRSVHHPEHVQRVVDRIRHSFATGEAWEDTFPLRSHTGEYRRFLSRAFPIRDEQGHVLRWFGTNTDIEERLRAEEELQRRITFEEQLIGIVSHDLRNPVHAIQLASELMLRREALDERQTKTLQRVLSSAERASRLVKDLLDFTRERMGKAMPLTPRPMDLHQASHGVVEEVRLAHPLRVLEEVHGGDGRGEWDADRLAQVLTNLLSNALTYGEPGSPVRVVTRGEDGSVLLQVHNFGEPIALESLPRLFQPFERGDGPKESRSIGLGLFIVDRIVRALGGTVEVHSTLEDGTTFTVRLPRAFRMQQLEDAHAGA